MLLRKPDSDEKKEAFALWYLIGFCMGNSVYFVVMMLFGMYVQACLFPVVTMSMAYYFYLCLRSYAMADY